MASTKRLLPTGECWCSCGAETAIGSFFLPGHDKTTESAVISVEYGGVPGFCKSATLKEVRKHGHVLTPGRYVGAEPQEDDGEPFAEKMARLTIQWHEQQAEAQPLDAETEANLARLGFGDRP